MTPAVIFDCDGVLADTELHGHLPAFNETFAEVGLPVRWSVDEYLGLLRIGGGKERMAAGLAPVLADRGLDRADQAAEIDRLHAIKTARYVNRVRAGLLPARPGIRRLVHAALDAGWRVAVASTSAEASVRAVLEHTVGTDAARAFSVFAGDVVLRKKPAPDIYLLAVRALQLDGWTVVVEDSAIGVRAARAAGLPVVMALAPSTAADDVTGASVVVSSLGEPDDPAEVLHDPDGACPDGVVDLATLEAVASKATLPAS